MPEFSGRTVFVTGASRGIGRAIAVRLGRGGANVVVASKSDDAYNELSSRVVSQSVVALLCWSCLMRLM